MHVQKILLLFYFLKNSNQLRSERWSPAGRVQLPVHESAGRTAWPSADHPARSTFGSDFIIFF